MLPLQICNFRQRFPNQTHKSSSFLRPVLQLNTSICRFTAEANWLSIKERAARRVATGVTWIVESKRKHLVWNSLWFDCGPDVNILWYTSVFLTTWRWNRMSRHVQNLNFCNCINTLYNFHAMISSRSTSASFIQLFKRTHCLYFIGTFNAS